MNFIEIYCWPQTFRRSGSDPKTVKINLKTGILKNFWPLP